ncbi:MAG: hypothetical protein ACREX3_03110, partial [Gammaproteobacteria bacterium]
VSLTIGAASSPCFSQGLCLKSTLNRSTDAAPHSLSYDVNLSGKNEDAVIERILAADASYGDNLGYRAFPGPDLARYNSNSYISGLMMTVGLPPIPFPVPLPGWNKPVPANAFR